MQTMQCVGFKASKIYPKLKLGKSLEFILLICFAKLQFFAKISIFATNKPNPNVSQKFRPKFLFPIYLQNKICNNFFCKPTYPTG